MWDEAKQIYKKALSRKDSIPTLIGGKNPQVQCAGIINIRNGKIYSVDTNSGHYRPNFKSLEKVNSALKKMCDDNPKLFDRRSEWRK